MKYLYCSVGIIILILLSGSIVSSQNTDHWETIINTYNIFQYHSSNLGEPDSDWRKPEFNDRNWDSGKNGIGYGDNDDNTIISKCISVCLRSTFTIKDKAVITDAILNIDYDDAFVAFLNGVEIARSTGLTGDFPPYNQTSSTFHEAVLYNGGTPENFLIQHEKLKTLINDGKNLLAIQVHNAGVNSSDLSSTTFFSVGISTGNRQYKLTPNWFKIPFIFTDSNLPIFIIDTKGKQIVDEPKTNVELKVIYNGVGKRNKLTDTEFHYNGLIGIELRGNSTMGFPKKPYTFETRTETGENNNVSLLGFPAENDWILRASYYDRTFIRNSLAHHLSREMGHWSSGNKHCELIIDDKYKGIYILVEKIKRTKNRLNLNKLKSDEISGEDITGGYIYEVAGQHNDFGYNRRIKYPKLDKIATEQLNHIRNYDDSFRAAIYQDYSASPLDFYNQWINLQTFIDFVLVQEVTRNPDGFGWSGYFHKDKNKPLSAGPVWDFDQSLCNSTFSQGLRTDLWIIDYEVHPNPPFWKIMLHEPFFEGRLKERWEELRQDKFSDDELISFIDSIANNLSESVVRNFEVWPILDVKFWREVAGYNQRDTYLKHVDFMKDWLINRLKWMDNELAKINSNSISDQNSISSEILIYPNPATEYIILDLIIEKSNQSVGIKIFNQLGMVVKQTNIGNLDLGRNQFKIELGSALNNGIYYVQANIGNNLLATSRFVISK